MKIEKFILSALLIFSGCTSNQSINQKLTSHQTAYTPESTEEVIRSVLEETDPPIRGVWYNPKISINMETISILIPSHFKCNVVKHKKYNYPVHSCVHMCPGQNPCLSSLYLVSIIPEKIFKFDEAVQKAKSEDFIPDSVTTMSDWMEADRSGAAKKIILSGGIPLAGNAIEGFYYDSRRNLTVKVQSLTIFMEPFSDTDWRRILVHNFVIFSSIKFQ